MNAIWKQKGHDWLMAVLWAACGIVPIPFGAFASGKPYIAASSVLIFSSYPLPSPCGSAIAAANWDDTMTMRR